MKKTPLQRKSPMKRSQPRRCWKDARAKVEREGVCRRCGSSENLQAAHVIGRECDEPKAEGSKTLYVHPDRIVPLCGAGWEPWVSCHHSYDEGDLDILPYLTVDEQVQAVRDAGGLVSAVERTTNERYVPVRGAA